MKWRADMSRAADVYSHIRDPTMDAAIRSEVSTPAGGTLRLIDRLVSGPRVSISAVLPSSSGRNSVSYAHHVHSVRPFVTIFWSCRRRSVSGRPKNRPILNPRPRGKAGASKANTQDARFSRRYLGLKRARA